MEKQLLVPDEKLTESVISAAINVHRELGPGLLETIYEKALMFELKFRGLEAKSQVPIDAVYRGVNLGTACRADIIVGNCLLLELKAKEEDKNIVMAQVMTYLKLLKFKRALLMNFNNKFLRDGIQRISI